MKIFELSFNVRWADIDANKHMRHSAYYDYATLLRVQLLKNIGMDLVTLSKLGIGPVLFREEAVFMREISMDDTIRVNVKLKRSREDASRWTFIHAFYKDDKAVAAKVTVEGVWLDLNKRKLTALPDHTVAGLLMDGYQPADLLCTFALVVWLWLPQCIKFEAKALKYISTID